MNYEKKINEFVKYFISGEKKFNNLKIGAEFEHFVVDKNSLRTINYYENNGIENILESLIKIGWNKINSEGNILALSKKDSIITLEPGGQIEISINPFKDISNIEKEYLDFLNDIVPILENNNQILLSIGYHPVSKIDDIPFIPKKRYEYMSTYFKSKGKYALNMMKGTCSTQVAIDYTDNEDYIKKFRVSNALTTIISSIFDNSPFFEGDIYNKNGLRTNIWLNCDLERCGVINGVLDKRFGYREYAEYLLNNEPIVAKKGDEFYFTYNKKIKDLFNPNDYKIDELEHFLTMFFPDVRTKKFIEIRMTDALPYPLNLSVLAFIKGILYNKNNLIHIYNYLLDVSNKDIEKSKKDVIEFGINSCFKNKKIIDILKDISEVSIKGLSKEEKKYMVPLFTLIDMKKTPSIITKEMLHLGINKATDWLNMNNLIVGDKQWKVN